MTGDMLQKPDLPEVQIIGLDQVEMPLLVLGTDGEEYEVLAWAARSTATLPGLSAEVGVREGGASELILRTVADCARRDAGHRTTHVAIDPYGNIPYADRDGRTVPGFGYNERMRRDTQASLSTLARQLDSDVLFLAMEDSEFFSAFRKGVPVYAEGRKERVNSYRLVHIDGPHAYGPVCDAAYFFGERLTLGGCMVFDNINYYDHGTLHRELLTDILGLELQHVGEAKALYRRTGWS